MNSLQIKLRPKLFDLLQHCELNCSAGCCGWAAFDLSDNWLSRWCEFRDTTIIAEARKDISHVLDFIDGRDSESKIDIEPCFSPTVATLAEHLVLIDDVLASFSD